MRKIHKFIFILFLLKKGLRLTKSYSPLLLKEPNLFFSCSTTTTTTNKIRLVEYFVVIALIRKLLQNFGYKKVFYFFI
jgi:predicted component of viral defense system (DUF524 family)